MSHQFKVESNTDPSIERRIPMKVHKKDKEIEKEEEGMNENSYHGKFRLSEERRTLTDDVHSLKTCALSRYSNS